MKRWKGLIVLTLFSFTLGITTVAANEMGIDDFSKTKVGDFPLWWSTYPFQGGKVKQVYKMKEEDGKRFISAFDNKDISLPIYKDFPWDLQKYPVLKWRWRATTLPKGAAENSRATNDSACGVYVPFGKTSGVALKYVWSSTLAVGNVWEKDPKEFFVIVKSSGAAKLNQWQEVSVNVLEEFKKHFGKNPSKNPSAVGIMTDGNAMHSASGCDYGDFRISGE
ncbi:MAG: DUF3047 domain-containing protein [Deltaproteobacteria bacterium]|nr:DUF3047 domain-containing protein [Deltaproteobacteria bacterium]